MRAYWRSLPRRALLRLPRPFIPIPQLDREFAPTADEIGSSLADLPLPEAGYSIGCVYTAMLPEKYRAERGVFYTPPTLCQRLIQMATDTGLDWKTARVLDASCGGAAFLAPVATRMAEANTLRSTTAAFNSIRNRLRGYEIDPFAAWLSIVLLEATLLPYCFKSGQRATGLIEVRDSLSCDHGTQDERELFDLVIGNPPYGRVSLSYDLRLNYSRSLYGHANLYGLFTDAALRWTAQGGLIAYVTPTSMLGGEYFKKLRGLLSRDAPPVAIDFVSERTGIFQDVLQETMLVVYRRSANQNPVTISVFNNATSKRIGAYAIPSPGDQPWLFPRAPEHSNLIARLIGMPTRLADYGYKVSTGPLVWNRHKPRFRATPSPVRFPVIWAEAISSTGQFQFRAEKVNHLPWFEPLEREQWVVTRRPSVLVQRTTAKEQKRRLIAAVLPSTFIRQHGGVVVENHLNMVVPTCAQPKVSPQVIAELLNSNMLDAAFRCVNGSVAVSAYELESLPLPTVGDAKNLECLILQRATRSEIQAAINRLYLGEMNAAAGVA